MNESSIRADVARRLSAMFPQWGTPTVDAPVLLSAGWESDIYQIDYTFPNSVPNAPNVLVDARGLEAQGALVARLYFGTGEHVTQKAQTEFDILVRLSRAGYPCPKPLWVDLGGRRTESPWQQPALIMTRAPGQPMWGMVFRGDESRRAWARQLFVAQFWALHRLDVAAVGLDEILPAPQPTHAVTAPLARIRKIAQQLPSIGMESALDWLTAHAPAIKPGRVGLIHWDFHPENLLANLLEPARADAPIEITVIDWSAAEIGDTRFDLAWTLAVVGSQEDEAAALDILHAYESLAGVQTEMDFFRAAACGRRLYVICMALMHGAEALGLRPGAEGVIRGQPGALEALYTQWMALSGCALPTVENLLQELQQQ